MNETFVDVRALKRRIAAMSGAEMRDAMQDPTFIAQCEAAGILVLKGSWAELKQRGVADPGKSSKP